MRYCSGGCGLFAGSVLCRRPSGAGSPDASTSSLEYTSLTAICSAKDLMCFARCGHFDDEAAPRKGTRREPNLRGPSRSAPVLVELKSVAQHFRERCIKDLKRAKLRPHRPCAGGPDSCSCGSPKWVGKSGWRSCVRSRVSPAEIAVGETCACVAPVVPATASAGSFGLARVSRSLFNKSRHASQAAF